MVYRISTGYVRPGIVKIGQPKKYFENFSASNVADVTMSLRSGRRLTASVTGVSPVREESMPEAYFSVNQIEHPLQSCVRELHLA